MKHFILASHHLWAEGMKDTIEFLAGLGKDIQSLSCYLDGDLEPVEDKVFKLFKDFDQNDQVFVFVDMFSGSVYQKFFPYMRENVHLICGGNVPLVLAMILDPRETLDQEDVETLIENAKNTMLYINKMPMTIEEDDE